MSATKIPVIGYAVIDPLHPDLLVQFDGDQRDEAYAYADFNGCSEPFPVVDFGPAALAGCTDVFAWGDEGATV